MLIVRPRLQQQGVMVTDPDAVMIPRCHGFKLGVEHHQLAWKRWFEDIRRQKAVDLVNSGEWRIQNLRQTESVVGEEIAWETVTGVCLPRAGIRDYWHRICAGTNISVPSLLLRHPKSAGTILAHAAAGKKFKHCHGRFETGALPIHMKPVTVETHL